MARRGNNEGSIYQRGDGRWAAAVSLGGGRRKHVYGKSREEVARKLTWALTAAQEGLPIPSDRVTVGRFLEQWLGAERPGLRAGTWRRYEQLARLHVQPELGSVRLVRLCPADLQRLYAKCLAHGLSSTTVHHVHGLLHRALGQATRWGLVSRNVASLVDPPRRRRREMVTLGPAEARRLLSAAKGNRLEAMYVLALATGMRQGELLALHWSDVDAEAGKLRVKGTLLRTPDGLVIAETKTRSSRRAVDLPARAIEALRRHRAVQAAERLRAGDAWEDWGLVFANKVGRPIEAGNLLRRSFWPLLEQAKLPRIRFHDLRHSAATLMLGRSVHPKVVSEILGHSQIGITLDLYSHVTPTMQREAAQAMEEVLRD